MSCRPWRPPAHRARLYCLVDPRRAEALLATLNSHFAAQPLVAVLVERRTPTTIGLASDPARPPRRRAPVAERDAARMLPPALRHETHHVRLIQPMVPLRRVHEDTDLTVLIDRTIAMDPEATSELWWRCSPRVLARLALRDDRVPDDIAARTLLGRILDDLPGYDPARGPLLPWLDAVVDRYAEEHAPASHLGALRIAR